MKATYSVFYLTVILTVGQLSSCRATQNTRSEQKDLGFGSSSAVRAEDPSIGTAEQYISACRNAGVPIPPAWGIPSWSYKGTVTREHVLANPDLETKIYVYNQSSGDCAALARGNPVSLLGIICTSVANGATCFWDNKTPLGLTVPIAGYDVSKGSGANLLKENCTLCHRGATPWIRIANEPTGTANLRSSADWYPLALNRKQWVNPQGPNVYGCSDCHVMPEANKRYCSIASVLVHRFKAMPPPSIQGGERTIMISAFDEYCANSRY